MNKKDIIVCVTASISAYKACEIVRALKKKGYSITVLMTKEAEHFVGRLTFRTLSENQVVVDMFDDKFAWNNMHITLSEKADAIVIVPATAHIIAKLANGLCDDIIICTVLASKAKVIVCPAMNDNMYTHPAFVDNLRKIRTYGYKIVKPIKGMLACGKNALGHLAEVDTIVKKIEKELK